MKKAIITGVTGQDGSYLAEYLLEKDYKVYGLVRRTATDNTQNLYNVIKPNLNFELVLCDLTSASSVVDVVSSIMPDEVYNLGAQSDVRISFDMPEYTMSVNATGTTNLLHAVRKSDCGAKFYQASTSEMFGKVRETPQSETTPFYPRSPYGVSKLAAHWMTINYRESYDMFNCTGILFNHESPRRGRNFVTRKVTHGLCRISAGKQDVIELGNLDAKRDWGHAKDYVRAMHMMLLHDKPDDYVVATGEQHSVREFVELAAPYFGFDIIWKGKGVEEVGIDYNTGETIIKINKTFYRPAEVDTLLGNCFKIENELRWYRDYTFKDLVYDMCVKENGE